MRLDDCFGNSEAQARVAGGAGFVRTIEPVEHAWQVFGRNAHSGVAHGRDHGILFGLTADAHLAVRSVVGDGVGVGVDDLDEGTAVIYGDEQAIGP